MSETTGGDLREVGAKLGETINKLPVTHTENATALILDAKNKMAEIAQGTQKPELVQAVQILDEALQQLGHLKGFYRETIRIVGEYAMRIDAPIPPMPDFPWSNLEMQPIEGGIPEDDEDFVKEKERKLEPVPSKVDPAHQQQLPTTTEQDTHDPNFFQLKIEGGFVNGEIKSAPGGTEAYLGYVNVRPDHRGQGKGLHLIKQFALEAIARGAEKLTADVSSTAAMVNFIKIFGVANIKPTDERNKDWTLTDRGQNDIADMVERTRSTGVKVEVDLSNPAIRNRLGL